MIRASTTSIDVKLSSSLVSSYSMRLRRKIAMCYYLKGAWLTQLSISHADFAWLPLDGVLQSSGRASASDLRFSIVVVGHWRLGNQIWQNGIHHSSRCWSGCEHRRNRRLGASSCDMLQLRFGQPSLPPSARIPLTAHPKIPAWQASRLLHLLLRDHSSVLNPEVLCPQRLFPPAAVPSRSQFTRIIGRKCV